MFINKQSMGFWGFGVLGFWGSLVFEVYPRPGRVDRHNTNGPSHWVRTKEPTTPLLKNYYDRNRQHIERASSGFLSS